jgi:hypothetical protein
MPRPGRSVELDLPSSMYRTARDLDATREEESSRAFESTIRDRMFENKTHNYFSLEALQNVTKLIIPKRQGLTARTQGQIQVHRSFF